tara:strand:+ start:148 stop:321 length:174 start_codon:yes stop_codon:yes gene_type:complete
MKDVKHYKKDGTVYEGPTHKTDGQLMSGKTHSSTSELLLHKQEVMAETLRRPTKKGY